MVTGASNTPQPFRGGLGDKELRNSFESESWDQLIGTIYSTLYPDVPSIPAGTTVSLLPAITVVVPFSSRIEIHFRTVVESAGANGGCQVQLVADGSNTSFGTDPSIPIDVTTSDTDDHPLTYFATWDVKPGKHTFSIDLFNNSFLSDVSAKNNVLMIRAGGIPTP